MDEVVLKVENLSKVFHQKNGDEIHVLDNVTFSLRKGEVLGIIGENGAGKSTLLKILSSIIKPSSGSIILNGNLTSILDVGTGFHPDLTGKENVYLSGKLNGLSTVKIDGLFDELVEFSGLDKFIEHPVKNYSNGMFMRLAFSVFAFMNPEILLLDEVFSVGDVGFQEKCIYKLKELVKSGVSIILVTHNLDDVRKICSRAAILKAGSLSYYENTNEGLDKYIRDMLINKKKNQLALQYIEFNEFIGDEFVQLLSISVCARSKSVQEPITMEDEVEILVKYQKLRIESLQLVLTVSKLGSELLLVDSNALRRNYQPMNSGKGIFTERIIFPANYFNHGLFLISLSIAKSYNFNQGSTEFSNLIGFEVHLSEWDKNNPWSESLPMPLRPKLEWVVNAIT